MAVNKVVYGNQTLIDLSTDTVASADDILLGKVGHLRDGSVVTGTASGGDQHGTIWQDGQGNVHLDDESGIALQSKTANPTESQQVIEPDEGYYALDKVTVGAISSSYVGSGVTRRSSSDLTASGATVTVPAGYYSAQASKTVASGTAGTPTATKGTVSNHAVSITPSVTNTTGYITGGTKNGTAVTVSASELVSGTKNITENGTGIDVTNYASVNVSIDASTDFLVTFTKDQNDVWQPDCTYAELYSAYTSSKQIIAVTNTYNPVNIYYSNDDGGFIYTVTEQFNDSSSYYANTGVLIRFNLFNNSGITDYGTEMYYDTYNANAVPSDVANGKVFYNAQGVQIGTSTAITPTGTYSITNNGQYDIAQYASVNVNVGNASVVSESDPVRFFDYDGTLLYSYSASAFQALTAMPANPSHSGLTSQGWNWSLADAKARLTAMGACDIGQMYVTDDGKTRIYVEMKEGRLSPYLGIGVNGTIVVDWGDNTTTSTISGTSLTTASYAQHTYASAGDYVIQLTVTSGSFSFFGVNNTSHILKKDTGTSSGVNVAYANCVYKIEIGSNANLGNFAFNYCYSLKTITIPNGVTSIGTYAFYNCYSLETVIIPNGVTSIGTYTFNGCYSLQTVAIPNGVTSIGTYAFSNCHTLKTVAIPNGVTNIGTYTFSGCYSLKTITIPNGVTSIGANAFYNCYSLETVIIPNGVTSISNNVLVNCRSLSKLTIHSRVTNIGTSSFSTCYGLGEIHFESSTPPSVANTNAFASIPTDCIIYVPTGTLSAYTSATNYPSSSTYTYVEE